MHLNAIQEFLCNSKGRQQCTINTVPETDAG